MFDINSVSFKLTKSQREKLSRNTVLGDNVMFLDDLILLIEDELGELIPDIEINVSDISIREGLFEGLLTITETEYYCRCLILSSGSMDAPLLTFIELDTDKDDPDNISVDNKIFTEGDFDRILNIAMYGVVEFYNKHRKKISELSTKLIN